MVLLVQTGVKHTVETEEEMYRVSEAAAEVTTGRFCPEAAVLAVHLVCVMLVSVLVIGCLASAVESLVTAESLPESGDTLLLSTKSELTDGSIDVAVTVVTAVVMLIVLE